MTEYTTERGFTGYAQLEDSYGADVRVQDSSAAEAAHVWIFIEGGQVGDNDGSAHLNEDQARQVRDALTAFLDDDPLEERLRTLIADLDYDLHKSLEADEETGEDRYPELAARLARGGVAE